MAPDLRADDEGFMRRALELAARGLGRTSPNPVVGAVVVADGCIVGEGWHQKAGQPHAEPLALAAAGEAALGATIYVTLEPCCHVGRTPPCTEAILEAGIARVVFACGDCDERCSGQGAARLREAGVEVAEGTLEAEARRLNEAYIKHKRTGLPFVTLKMACSLDGKTATREGDSRWISGEASRLQVHRMRDRSDAVMVGVGTVLADDPSLTTRLPEDGRDALRIVVDSLGRTPPTARVVTGPSEAGCLIAVTAAAPAQRVAALQAAGAEVVVVPATADSGAVDLPALMAELGRRNVMSVLLEGGATLAGAAVEAGVVDRMVMYMAPKLIGGAEAAGVLGGAGIAQMAQARGVTVESVERVDEDIRIEARLCSPD